MNPLRLPAFALLAAGLLSGCNSLVGSLVPPVTVDNPAGLNGAKFVGTPFASVQRVGSNLTIQPALSFANTGTDARGLTPQDLDLSFSVAALALRDCTPPAGSYTVDVTNARLVLSDSAGSAEIAFPNVTLNFTVAGDGSVTVATNRFAATVPGAAVFNVVNAGPQPNAATGSARAESPQDALAPCKPELTVGGASATFKNFR